MLEFELEGSIGGKELAAALRVEDGECVALTGPSGAGKTTLLRMLAGLHEPDRGSIRIDQRCLYDSSSGVDLPTEQRGCGYVFQAYALFDHMSVRKNVEYGIRGESRKRRAARALDQLAQLGVDHLAEKSPRQLSGGERRRVALARVLAQQPSFLLFDEPLSALDVRSRARAADEIREAVERSNVPAILVTHDFIDAAMIAERIAVLDDGRVVQTGSADQLTSDPATPFVADLTGANVLRGEAAPHADGLSEVALDGGGTAVSTDAASGRVLISVQPWEITLERADHAPDPGSAQNSLAGIVRSVKPIANRVRVAIELPQPLVAEVTPRAVDQLDLRPGRAVRATFKASATRLY